MKTVTLTFVKNDKKVSKKGKPYVACSIKTEEMGETWINGFGNDTTKSWQVGDAVQIEIYTEEWEGKTYTKFRTPNPHTVLENRVTALERQVALLTKQVGAPSGTAVTATPQTSSEEDLTDLPF